jgi:ABC-type nitrate/sulfonate/bicarbonate transport system permease component
VTPLASQESNQIPGVLRRRTQAMLSRRSGLLLIAALLLLWEASARSALIVSENWPPVSVVFVALVRGLASGELFEVIGPTLYRFALGYAIGISAGVVVGFAFALAPFLRRMFEPIVELLRPIPAPALVPPLVLFLGVDDLMKVTIVGATAFFPVAINTMQGAVGVEPTYLAVARTFRARAARILIRIIVPGTLPYVLAGMRISLALALVVTVVSEMIAGASGIGYYLIMMQYAVRSADMYAAIFVIAALGAVLNAAFVAIERRLIFWYAPQQ